MDTMTLKEEQHGDHAVMVGGMSPFTVGHQSVVHQMHRGRHTSVNVYTTQSTSRPIPAEKKVGYISKAVPQKTNVASTVTPLHALSHMYSEGKRGHVTFYGGSDRADIANRLKTYNGKQGAHGYYKFDSITFKQVGAERSEKSQGMAGVSGSKARASKSPEELKQYIPKELHKDATNIFNDINKPKEKKPIRESYLAEDVFNMLDDVRTKDGKLGYIVYRGSNYVTIQLEENKTTKAWIYEIEDIKLSNNFIKETVKKPKPTHDYTLKTQRIKEQKIPALLMPSKKILEESNQVQYLDYRTKNFNICPSAKKLMDKLVIRKDLNPKYVKQAIMALDKMFGLEKLAQTETLSSTDIHDFTMYTSIAHDTLNLLGIQDNELGFIVDHFKSFAKLADHDDDTLADDPSSHTVVSHGGDIDEWAEPQSDRFLKLGRAEPGRFKKVVAADKETRFNPETGKFYNVPAGVIISKGHKKVKDSEEDDMKTVKEGIDKTMGPGTQPDKPVGLVSFNKFNELIGRHKAEYTTDAQATQDEKQMMSNKSKHAKVASKRIQMGLD